MGSGHTCNKMKKRNTEAIYIVSPFSLSARKCISDLARHRGWIKVKRGNKEFFFVFKTPSPPITYSKCAMLRSPRRSHSEAPQEYCSSPPRHKLWFSTVNKHDVVLTEIAQTGMFLFYFCFLYLHTVSHVCMWRWERKKMWNRMVYFRPSLL